MDVRRALQEPLRSNKVITNAKKKVRMMTRANRACVSAESSKKPNKLRL